MNSKIRPYIDRAVSFLLAGICVFNFASIAHAESAPGRAKEAGRGILIFCRSASGGKMLFSGDKGEFPEGVVISIVPEYIPPVGGYMPPDCVRYWEALDPRNANPQRKEIEEEFPIVKGLSEDQQASAAYFTNLKSGRYVLGATLPGYTEPIVSKIKEIEIGRAYDFVIPDFLYLKLEVPQEVLFEGRNKLLPKWMIVARDLGNAKGLVLTRGNLKGSWRFWGIAGHSYEGWVLVREEVGQDGVKMFGYRFSKFRVDDGMKNFDPVNLELLNTEKPPISFAAELEVEKP